ncbi:alpha/beta hydrolase [Mycobacterium intermedium]|uniref:Alpha/beta hydrolase n=1 Tax=Mycobacterium intermedium TaxID=28445 RepID=A0A1E3SK94_MYCIE|nr:alpha/beta hydrolase fold domain-containing protein [Mycobacterium intermedium]MCV6962827.1 alpha/beta hydrolase fold domain-containing protein [Mycobacterium intermedium]ODR02555.1 alpha/beta hydrolase [Mycobacterium intermedium]OPE46916.1 alpha/beta hydrolase [Mycobacterium intermedium]ORB09922.1 alpha/beta hydrolase [Mycobacterium intermedium]
MSTDAPEAAERLDPALRPVAITRTDFSLEAIPLIRASMDGRRRNAVEQQNAIADVTVEDATAESVPVRIYRGGPTPAPVVIYCHAGGFALGNLDTDHRQCLELARRARCTVVSVEYRLAPENPYPAAPDDAAAALRWTAANAASLGVDSTRLAVAGSSAGAALAAGLAHRAADGRLPPIAFQLLHQPVLDDRPTASRLEFRSTPAFDGAGADLMWSHYLAGRPGSPDAVPARRSRLEALPPALITCAEIDPFRDEAIDYAMRLLRAGVSTELHVFPRVCHGFDSLLPEWSVSQRLFALQGDALSAAFYARSTN